MSALQAKAWVYEEARKLLTRVNSKTPDKGYVLLETGYGPSGLPHIGTFGEVARTTFVRKAFAEISDIPTRLFAFSDDMDGLRKVPDNVPNQEMLAKFIGKPLTQVPDPFGTHDSFGAHNNARLCAFLDAFGFEYEFQSSTEFYKTGKFDATLLLMLEKFDDILKIILPTLGPDRRETYSPFLPVCPRTGVVLQVPVIERKLDAGTIVYRDPETNELVEVPVTGGHCKMQWKADWAMRWKALDVDYEMSGKDLIDSVKLSSQICRVLGAKAPENLTYELFLDDQGGKISKSKGNGLSVEEWLRYGTQESLALFMYQKPQTAKRLYFDVIPKHVDEYLSFSNALRRQSEIEQLENPAHHIKSALPRAKDALETPLNFSILLNLASVCNTEDKSVLWGFISKYDANLSPASAPLMDDLVGHALVYYRDFILPHKKYRAPSDIERAALEDMIMVLKGFNDDAKAEEIQTQIYEVGKRHAFAELRDWFKCVYQVVLGQDDGPRMGSFVQLFGRENMIKLIEGRL